jgi:two-component system response regulator HydG
MHAVESAAVLSAGEEIGIGDLPAQLSVRSEEMLAAAAGKRWTLEALERAYIREVLERTRGNKSEAARILGIHRKTLHEKLRRMEKH